ncbi:MAG: hypothetical protein H0T45_09220 [Pyrinomonadaceae bacterium]|nr:hypothetical protein [Pyrinomonadaceae bacterium]
MKRRLVGTCAAVVALAVVSAAAVIVAAAKIDFSGTWVLDPARSESVPAGMEQALTVTHTGDTLAVVLKIKPPQGAERTINYTYEINGKETEFTADGPPGGATSSSKAKRTASWSADGNSIEVKEEIPVQTPEGPDTTYATRKWTLSPDGKDLNIEQKQITPTGTSQFKRIFVKKS